jgi:cell fate regulator YaaT (PSP1 superfamily)
VPTIVGVKLRNPAKPVLFETDDLTELKLDDIVLANTERGEELGRIAAGPAEQGEGERVDPANRLVRLATPEDLANAEELHRKEREALSVYRRLVTKHKLDMKPTDVEFSFDGTRAVFYFVAEERVDFRDLVRDLAAEFHTRVDMRQIGVRDEARMIGGLGHCGEQLCCDRFGGEFQPVSIRMAKEQDLPLNPLKISGLCGRLMCCLRYEYEAYKDFKGRAPKKGAIIEVGDQKGKVVEFNTPKETVTMRLEQGGSITVALGDMECCKGESCPCKVKPEALERKAEALSVAIGSAASIRDTTAMPPQPAGPGRRAERPGDGKRAEKSAEKSAEKPAESAERTSRRRRRRPGGDAAQPQQAAGGKQPQRAQGQRGQSGKPKQATGQPGGAQPTAGGQAPPSGDAAASPVRRRRRRRSPGAGAPE